MPKPRRLLILLGIIVLCVLAWLHFFTGEPTYRGRKFSSWLQEYCDLRTRRSNPSGGPSLPHPLLLKDRDAWERTAKQCEDAIRHIGTNALPVLLEMTAAQDSPLKTRINSLLNKQRLVSFRFRTAQETRPITNQAFEILRSDAKSAVPALTVLLSHPDSDVRRHAAFHLGCIGPDAAEAVPQLIKNLNDANARFYSLQALAHINRKPELVVPILIQSLQKPMTSYATYDVSIVGLGLFGTNSKSGFSAIIPFLTNDMDFVRQSATNALKRIDPIAAANLGIE